MKSFKSIIHVPLMFIMIIYHLSPLVLFVDPVNQTDLLSAFIEV